MRANTKIKGKIVLLGDGAVGKTSLIRRYVLDYYKDEYIQTIGTKVTKKEIMVRAQNDQVYNTTLMIWDLWGQRDHLQPHLQQFHRYQPQAKFFHGTKGALLVCDLTRRETMSSLNHWIEALFAVTGPIPLIFLANKGDLTDQFAFTLNDLAWVAKQYNSPSIMTSAKTGENVETAFYLIAQTMVHLSEVERVPG